MKAHQTLKLWLALLCTAVALHAGSTGKAYFASPNEPGTLSINVSNTTLRITPSTEAGLIEYSSNVEQAAPSPQVREDGLRVLGDTNESVSLHVDGNTGELTYSKNLWQADSEIHLLVPADTTLKIQCSWGVKLDLRGLTGALSVEAVNCEVHLEDMAATTSIELASGKIFASYRELNPSKPISISNMSGAVQLFVPEDSKATIRFRTHNGAILTDFDEQRLKTKSEGMNGAGWGSVAGKHAAMAAKLGMEIGREISEQAKDIAQEVREAVKQAKEELKEQKNAPTAPQEKQIGAPPAPPAPPRPNFKISIPAVSGGKVVSGTLNEGGTAIQVTLMNGDVTFRKTKEKQ